MSKCTRCGNERKTIFIHRPGGHTWTTPPNFVPRTEQVCGDCLTDNEIARELNTVVEFILGVLIKRETNPTAYPSVAAALETARAFFMVRNNDPDSNRGRQAAVRALGLNNQQPHSSAKG